jgi:hypothetical protein
MVSFLGFWDKKSWRLESRNHDDVEGKMYRRASHPEHHRASLISAVSTILNQSYLETSQWGTINDALKIKIFSLKIVAQAGA